MAVTQETGYDITIGLGVLVVGRAPGSYAHHHMVIHHCRSCLWLTEFEVVDGFLENVRTLTAAHIGGTC